MRGQSTLSVYLSTVIKAVVINARRLILSPKEHPKKPKSDITMNNERATLFMKISADTFFQPKCPKSVRGSVGELSIRSLK